jgi:hypothetical protein
VIGSAFFLAADALMPIRALAVIALIAVVVAFIYVVTHLRKIERMIVSDNLVPVQRGPRNNMVLVACAVPVVITALLLFLILKA